MAKKNTKKDEAKAAEMKAKSVFDAMVAGLIALMSVVGKEFEQIGIANQIAQAPLRQISQKKNQIEDLEYTIRLKSEDDRSDTGENGGDNRNNTLNEERQIAWKTAEIAELIGAYREFKKVMKEATGREPFENKWTEGILEYADGLG